MGWSTCDAIPENADAFFSDMFTARYGTVLASAIVEGSGRRTALDGAIAVTSVWYGAVLDARTCEVSCSVRLFRSGHASFAFKEMHETWGPVAARCPAHILDMLTPLPDECEHYDVFCRYCDAEIDLVDGLWLNFDVPMGEIENAAHFCSLAAGGGPLLHEPDGFAECGTCLARDWRRRCRENVAI